MSEVGQAGVVSDEVGEFGEFDLDACHQTSALPSIDQYLPLLSTTNGLNCNGR